MVPGVSRVLIAEMILPSFECRFRNLLDGYDNDGNIRRRKNEEAVGRHFGCGWIETFNSLWCSWDRSCSRGSFLEVGDRFE